MKQRFDEKKYIEFISDLLNLSLEDINVSINEGAIAFIPPVTKNVFLKYYNTSVDNLREWSENDAKAYKENILKTLREFDVMDSMNNWNEENHEQ